MKDIKVIIDSNKQVGTDIFLMRLKGDLSEIKNPGEFIEITIPNYYLRRPISVHDYTNEYVDILYKVLGHGTKDLSEFTKGTEIDALVGLGNGFDLSKSKKPLLVAGGIGIAPMYALAKEFNKLGIKPILIYGARNASDIVLVDEFKELCEVYLCTDDGSKGYNGNVVSFMKENNIDYDYYYACGPHGMLKALACAFSNGCVSLEARMGCGFGACMGCSIKTTSGPKRVCKEGPVFEASEVEF